MALDMADAGDAEGLNCTQRCLCDHATASPVAINKAEKAEGTSGDGVLEPTESDVCGVRCGSSDSSPVTIPHQTQHPRAADVNLAEPNSSELGSPGSVIPG